MQSFIINEILAPMGRRVGTGVAGYLVAKGATEDLAHLVVTGGFAGVAIGVDLFTSWLNRKRG